MNENSNEAIEEELNSEGRASGVEREPDGSDEHPEITDPFDPKDIDIKTKNPSMDSLIKRLDHDEIDLNPDFQRKGGIWSKRGKSRLIESLLLNIPLPVFYVASDADGNWIVVDGLQRLTALNQFIRERAFALEGLEFLKQFNGQKFGDLPRPMQRRILESEPVFHIIQASSSKAVTQTIFKRINTGGMPLSAQEIRHALYQGPVTKLLKELAAGEAFLRATGGSMKDDRMADRECVLRYLAFSIRGIDAYDKPDLDKFLSDTMEQLNEKDEQSFVGYRAGFERAMERAFQIFGGLGFRRQRRGWSGKSPINKALFEAWSVALGGLDDEQAERLIGRKEAVNEAFINLLESDRDFVTAISNRIWNVTGVKTRFSRIHKLIAHVLET
ncbi:DUF262 domain-containing protein [Candidatus Thiosymbion oneisti]|uniref:DUF262 domain-containing protein n=1 Tax=Candidatus Thiosymbion oneisti TaxID=589554 RepID=UPI000A8D7FC9|nr:DUF262 domain-containing protein [Candidatus Thiosymbion oneisti]